MSAKTKTLRSFFDILPSSKKVKLSSDIVSVNVVSISSYSTKQSDDSTPAPTPIVNISSNVRDESSNSESELLRSLDASWKSTLTESINKKYFQTLLTYVESEMRSQTIFPPREDVFNAFNFCTFNNVKVVIIGQDPYHGAGQAHGLAFSVKKSVVPPPSLKNIFKEAKNDVGIPMPTHGCLESWARQGVLLLNTCLTVRSGLPNSHQGKGWEEFTDAVVKALDKQEKGLVFMLWGNPAQSKCASINSTKHHIIKTSHPSPLGAAKTTSPFLGSRCFSRCNNALQEMGYSPVDWTVK